MYWVSNHLKMLNLEKEFSRENLEQLTEGRARHIAVQYRFQFHNSFIFSYLSRKRRVNIVSVLMSIEEVALKNKEALEKIVVKEIAKIESGLTIIGNQIPIDDHKTVDILCHDENGQLVVVKLSKSEDDIMLFEGLHALNEVNSARRMLKFYNQNFKISDKEPSRLILLAPSFSNNLLTLANSISGIRIDLYEWEYLQFGDNKALRVKPLSLSQISKNRE